MRFSTFDREGFVAFLAFGMNSDFFTISKILSVAIFLFCSCVLLSETVNCRIPSALMRFFSLAEIISFPSIEKHSLSATFHITVTEVSTLFTFCPPAPEEREVLYVSSLVKSFIWEA